MKHCNVSLVRHVKSDCTIFKLGKALYIWNFPCPNSFLISRFGECLKKFRVRIFQDLPDLSEVGEDLQAYCATALKADDSKFWSKLK